MRFAKHSRGWLSGRRLFSDDRPDRNEGVATEERSALLSRDTNGNGSARESGPVVDPTQRLLTALGRFQRQVARAEAGAPQDEWSDECMNQLIMGIELAMAQEWTNVMQALTDTARILQSYENEGKAHLCVPFLQDSYEILCLMVGDLIVDNVRSGVMQKWRDRYAYAVEDLARAGIPLVEDDVEEAEDADTPPAAPARRPAGAAEPESAAEAFFTDEAEEEESAAEELDTDETAEDVTRYEEAPESETEEREEEPVDVAAESAEDAVTPFEDIPDDYEMEEEETGNLPSLDELEDTPAPAQAVEPVHEPVVTHRSKPKQPVEDLFSMAETVEPQEPAPAPAPAPVHETPRKPETPRSKPVAAPPPRAEAPAVVHAMPAMSDEAEALLRTTQQALSSGNVADAKLLALELAMNMARLEANRAEAHVKTTEDDLAANSEAIAQAENRVGDCEQEVALAERQTSEREQELSVRRDRSGNLRDQVAGIRATIEEIESQIRALEARRNEEMERLTAAQSEQDEALAAESRVQTEIEQLNESCQTAQDTLDEARSEVDRLKGLRAGQESELREAMETLEVRRQAVAQIAQTIDSIRGPAPVQAKAAESAPREIDEGLF